MKLSKEDVLKLAALCKLRLSDEEVEKFQTELSSILNYVDQLDGVDTEGLEPTYQVTGLKNVFRADELSDQVDQKELLKNVPNIEGKHIKVKRMVE